MQVHLCLRRFMNKCICAFVSFMNICKRDFKPTEMVCRIFGPGMLRPATKVGHGKVWYESEMRNKSHLNRAIKIIVNNGLSKTNFPKKT